jgi:hypothetical protein
MMMFFLCTNDTMAKLLKAAFCSVVSGNLLITLVEKTLNSGKDIERLREVVYASESRIAAAAAYPADLLMNKLIAWMAGAFVAGLVLRLVSGQRNKWIQAIVILFYLTAAYANIFIVPHPSWMVAAIPAIFIVPFMGGLECARFFESLPEYVFFKRGNSNRNAGSAGQVLHT